MEEHHARQQKANHDLTDFSSPVVVQNSLSLYSMMRLSARREDKRSHLRVDVIYVPTSHEESYQRAIRVS